MKIKNKEMQLALAGKIVQLEERLDQNASEREAHLLELEEIHQQELDKTKLGIQQRESHLLSRLSDIKERNSQLEIVNQELNA